MKPRVAFALLFVFGILKVIGCECPPSGLSRAECKKYEIIFKGKVLSSKTCDDRPGEAVFEVQELYKGNAQRKFTVLYKCDSECAMKFTEGDEWVIYSNYKQMGNAMMDWCSRSRKYFKNDNEDFYTVNYGNDYYDEVKFLQDSLGIHRLIQGDQTDASRNRIPGVTLTIILVVASLLCIVLFYWIFNRYFKF